jgi:glycerol transport system permease protein
VRSRDEKLPDPDTATDPEGSELMEKTVNQKAWFLVLPVLLLVAFSAVIPLMTVVNYSVQDTFGNNQFFWAGLEWFDEMLHSERMWNALSRQLMFSAIILVIEIPLGIFVALNMPKSGFWSSFCLVMMSLPLLIPWNVVGTIWQIFGRVDIGLLGSVLDAMGISYNYTQNSFAAWITIIVMDVWHWTSLVALLAYAGLKSIPDAYYQAAKIDQASRWKVFRFIELPKMMGVLMIATLLRFMDSFMIYTEPFVVTGGGPGNATTLLSIDLVKMALGQFDLGPAAAFSLMYFLVILLISWVFYTVMTNLDKRER